MTNPHVGRCSHCLEGRELDEDGLIEYHDWPPFTRQICEGAKKPPQSAEDQIRIIQEALVSEDENKLKELYNTDPLVHALITVGSQVAERFHHCKSCDGHSCDV